MLIESLKVFCDTVDFKSFSKAAEANYITQSAVSQQIRKLERDYKTSLIEREKRDFSLTHAGEIVYREAKVILERYERMNHLLGKASQEVAGTIRVATIHGVGLHELPPYIKKFLKLYPQVNVKLDYMRDKMVYEEVLQRRADLGIAAFPRSRPHIQVLNFTEDILAIVCHPKHRFARQGKMGIEKIGGENFVAFEKGIPTRAVVDRLLHQAGISVKMTMQFDNIETLKRAIEIDAGVSILPMITVKNEIERGTLKAVQISGKPPTRPLGIILEKGRALPLSVTKFIELLRENV